VTGSVDKAVLDALAAGTRVVSTSDAFTSAMPGVTAIAFDPRAIADALMSPRDSSEAMQTFVREQFSLKRLITAVISGLSLV
jgi:hypothetical protein